MIIQSSSINSSASRRYQSTQSTYTQNTQWDNATGTSFTDICAKTLHVNVSTASYNGTAQQIPEDQNCTRENISEFSTLPEEELEGKQPSSTIGDEMNELMQRFKSFHSRSIPSIQEKMDMVRDMQRQSLDYLIRILFGEDLPDSNGVQSIDRTTTPGEASASNPTTLLAEELGEPLGTGGHHEYFYYCAEKETTCFETTGTAITADGRKLSFNISLEMSRSFTEMASEQIDFGQPRLCDPLVINLNTNVASVSDQKFFFDINADGTQEEISMLDAASGYLALDKNEDGAINDGSELFGTTSGNGFKDLLAHDEDGNGWIDEADSIFQKLKVWSMNADGTSTLIDLKEAGVGAIYLGYENTEFSLKDAENKTNAVIQKTGLFLYEDGDVGTVQQMDLAV